MSHPPADSEASPQPSKILLVEDNFENRDMLTRRLQRRGFTVCSAPDGSTGVAMSVSERPDVILMDVALGEMDGWQATRLIKPIFDTSSPRVLRKSLIRIAARSVSSNL
ncbi:MAG: response regulator [Rubrivivax sp.]